jgi:hypothetical protein
MLFLLVQTRVKKILIIFLEKEIRFVGGVLKKGRGWGGGEGISPLSRVPRQKGYDGRKI